MCGTKANSELAALPARIARSFGMYASCRAIAVATLPTLFDHSIGTVLSVEAVIEGTITENTTVVGPICLA